VSGAVKGKKGVAAGVSVAILVPTITLVSVLLLGLVMQANNAQLAGANAADLQAEEGKKYLRAAIIRGASNQSLVNLYAAGKLPIHVDYLLATAYDGTVLAEKNGLIISLNPGDNVTLAPSQLDTRLAPYDGDYWRMRREVKALILHTSDGNTFYLSWGPWGGALAATFSTNTATTSTSYTTTTTTHTVSASVTRTINIRSTSTYTVRMTPRTFTTEPLMFVSASCNVQTGYNSYYYGGSYRTDWYDLSISCTVSVSGIVNPPYSYTLYAGYCISSGSASSNTFTVGCNREGTYATTWSDSLIYSVGLTVYSVSKYGSCTLQAGYGQGSTSCTINM
jgi:hypothetical protein